MMMSCPRVIVVEMCSLDSRHMLEAKQRFRYVVKKVKDDFKILIQGM